MARGSGPGSRNHKHHFMNPKRLPRLHPRVGGGSSIGCEGDVGDIKLSQKQPDILRPPRLKDLECALRSQPNSSVLWVGRGAAPSPRGFLQTL
jgi:hypothetical protein